MRKTKPATIVDVAKLANVSTATAARVFDPKWEGRVRESTQQKVLLAAKELGYHGSNALVRGLQGHGTNIIALVVGATTGYFYAEVLLAFVHELQQRGKQVLIFESHPSLDLQPILKQVYSYRVDGVIITSNATALTVIEHFDSISVPVVTFNVRCPNSMISCVYSDATQAGARAAAYLLAQGHRHFYVISGNQCPSRDTPRTDGFCEYIRANGGFIDKIVDADYQYSTGYAISKDLFTDGIPDAIFCADDCLAAGVIDGARDFWQLNVPQDVSVMGFDGTSIGQFTAYNLTTLRYPVREMVCDAVDILQTLSDGQLQKIEHAHEMTLWEHGSVRKK